MAGALTTNSYSAFLVALFAVCSADATAGGGRLHSGGDAVCGDVQACGVRRCCAAGACLIDQDLIDRALLMHLSMSAVALRAPQTDEQLCLIALLRSSIASGAADGLRWIGGLASVSCSTPAKPRSALHER